LLSHIAWRDVTLTMDSATTRWSVRNDYARTSKGAWSLPAIAEGAEAWLVQRVDGQRRARPGAQPAADGLAGDGRCARRAGRTS
jgi:hypothetical protein